MLAALERESVAVAAVTVARPALDDVYLRHTGRTFAAARGGGGADDDDWSPHTGVPRPDRLLRLHACASPAFVVIMLIQPMIWLLLFGQLFKRVVELPGFASGAYIDFLTPGVVVMTVLFSSGWAGMAFIEDMDRGVMDRMLSSPVSRGR